MSENIILTKSYQFALKIVRLHIDICNNKRYVYPISQQMLKAGTSIGANAEEAIGGHTEKDFAAKLSISYKEAREVKYWIRLLTDSGIINELVSKTLLRDVEEIIRILGSILKTMKSKNKLS